MANRAPMMAAFLLILGGCAAPGPYPAPSSDPVTSPRTEQATDPPSLPPATPTPPLLRGPLDLAGCTGTGTVEFQNSPLRAEDFESLMPYGGLAGGHVTPIDHMYFGPPADSVRDQFEVRAIADGVISVLAPRDINVDQNRPKLREWRMEIAHTCTFESYFDLITQLEPALYGRWNQSQKDGFWTAVPVKAGERVGRIGAQTLDFGVYDLERTLTGFIVPEHYTEPWKIHTVDPFPHFVEPVRSMLLSKLLRQAEPRAGKIDYDIDGRASGNWFQVGTGGYLDGGIRWDHWDGHFAFVYDSVDPTQVRFSIGNWSARPAQFGIVGNAPDPSQVSIDSGLVNVELAYWQYYARNRPDAASLGGSNPVRPGDDIYAENNGIVEGTALLQLLEPRLLKVEVFPGATSSNVTGFTEAARLYER